MIGSSSGRSVTVKASLTSSSSPQKARRRQTVSSFGAVSSNSVSAGSSSRSKTSTVSGSPFSSFCGPPRASAPTGSSRTSSNWSGSRLSSHVTRYVSPGAWLPLWGCRINAQLSCVSSATGAAVTGVMVPSGSSARAKGAGERLRTINRARIRLNARLMVFMTVPP